MMNRKLFDRLKACFGRVKVTAEGVQMKVATLRLDEKGRSRPDIVEWGETYVLNCPFCGDTRGRCSVNHRFGTRDPETGGPTFLGCKCFNEEACFEDRLNIRRFYAELFPDWRLADGYEPIDLPKSAVAKVGPIQPIAMPSNATPVSALDDEHPAHVYLRGRGFDPDALAEQYGVAYVDAADDVRPNLRDPRLVAPMVGLVRNGSRGNRWDERQFGWIARAIGPLGEGGKKYLMAAGTQKAHMLYGMTLARKSTEPLVIVEGVTDVWRIGQEAVALIGTSMSTGQAELVATFGAGRPVIVWLDEDADGPAAKVGATIKRMKREAQDDAVVAIARTPAGRDDPAACRADEVRRVLREALTHGVVA